MGADDAWKAHPTAVVDDGARIGAGTVIWHWTHVMSGARIGKRCTLGQNVFVAGGTTLGDGVKVQNNVSVYEGVHLADGVFCGPSVVFTNVTNPRSHVSRKHEYRPTRVGCGATLGANCTVVCGHEIGRYAFVAAGAVVTRDVPDYALAVGVPARVRGYVCSCGVRLAPPWGAKPRTAKCGACGARYRWDGSVLAGAK
jgi:UDP-2-acetamido-3-amino-2,3-dideoxy-glucuronate N-acetyltransferase